MRSSKQIHEEIRQFIPQMDEECKEWNQFITATVHGDHPQFSYDDLLKAYEKCKKARLKYDDLCDEFYKAVKREKGIM